MQFEYYKKYNALQLCFIQTLWLILYNRKYFFKKPPLMSWNVFHIYLSLKCTVYELLIKATLFGHLLYETTCIFKNNLRLYFKTLIDPSAYVYLFMLFSLLRPLSITENHRITVVFFSTNTTIKIVCVFLTMINSRRN